VKNTKLLQVLESFDKKELFQFKKYLQSPLFNHREDVHKLFEYLNKERRKKKPKLDKETIFSAVSPSRRYEDKEFHLLMSYLFKLAENFIALREYLQDENEVEIRLMQSYRRRSLAKHFNQTARRVREKLEKQPFRDRRYFQLSSRLVWEEYQVDVVNKPSGELPLSEMIELTDIAYFAQKLRQLCLIKVQQTVYSTEYKLKEQDGLLTYLNNYNLAEFPVLDIYFRANQLLSDDFERQDLSAFILKLIANSRFFQMEEVRELYLMAINLCIKKVNSGATEYFREMLELYQDGLAKNFLLENNRISRFAYHNAVAAALYSKEFEWAESFIKDFQVHLDEAFREGSYSYNLAKLEFERGHYGESLQLLQKANYQDVLLNLAAKTILLKIYFKTDEFDILEAHLAAMKSFLRRKKILGYHRKNYQNLIRFTQKLMSVNYFEKKELNKLRKEIQSAEILTERVWLLNQLEA
jgi:hypothetical protein